MAGAYGGLLRRLGQLSEAGSGWIAELETAAFPGQVESRSPEVYAGTRDRASGSLERHPLPLSAAIRSPNARL